MRQKPHSLQSPILDENYWRDPSGGHRARRVGAGHAILQDPSIGTHASPVRSTNRPERTVAARHGPCKLPFGLRSGRPARAPEPAESIVSCRATGPRAMVQSRRLRCGVASTLIQSHRIHGRRRTRWSWPAHYSVPSQFADRHGHRHGDRNPPPRRQSAGD
jgi:hypothetical protein